MRICVWAIIPNADGRSTGLECINLRSTGTLSGPGGANVRASTQAV